MKYLSFDIEATGLGVNDYIIEFAMVPFCTESKQIEENLGRTYKVTCPSFESLRPKLDPWVIEHNEQMIRDAHDHGLTLDTFQEELETYLTDDEVRYYFFNRQHPKGKITLFGKSLNAIDLPFMNRDLGWSFMRKYFHHRVLDLSSVAYALVDMGKLPPSCRSGSGLMDYYKLGEVKHTAMEDAINTAKLYLHTLD